MSIIFSPPYIKQAFLVVTHNVDLAVRTRIADVEKHFSDFVKGEAHSTNVDANTPPPIPRLIINDGNKKLTVSQNRIQIEFNFEQDLGFDKSLAVVMKKAMPFLTAVSNFQPVNAESMIGFVVHIQWPSLEQRSDIAKMLADHFYTKNKLGEFDAFDLKLGFVTDALLFKNLAVSAYEVREVTVVANPAVRLMAFESDSLPITETGVGVNLDINNRARLRSTDKGKYDFHSSAKAVVDEMKNLVQSEIYSLLPSFEVLK